MPNVKLPSRHDVELAIQELEIEDAREKEAIRNFWARERADEARQLSLRWRLTIIFCAGLFAAFVSWKLLVWIIDGVLQAIGR